MQRLLPIAGSFAAGAALLFARGTDLGAIRRTVTDSSGAVVAGATALGAEADNLINDLLRLPDHVGADGRFMYAGNFNVTVDPNTSKLQRITGVTRNPNIGRLMASYPQDGVDRRWTIRRKLRITF